MAAQSRHERAPDVVAVVRDDVTHRVLGLATFLSSAFALTTSRVVDGRAAVDVVRSGAVHAEKAKVSVIDKELGLAVLELVLPGPSQASSEPLSFAPPPVTSDEELYPWSGRWYNPSTDALEDIVVTFHRVAATRRTRRDFAFTSAA